MGCPPDRGGSAVRGVTSACSAAAVSGAAAMATRMGAGCARVACGAASSWRAGAGVTEQQARSLASKREGCGAEGSPFAQQHDFMLISGPHASSAACAAPAPDKARAVTAATIRVGKANRIS